MILTLSVHTHSYNICDSSYFFFFSIDFLPSQNNDMYKGKEVAGKGDG